MDLGQKQHTLRNPISATGTGLNTGKQVYVTLRPAPADTGIVFRRLGHGGQVQIAARLNNLTDGPTTTLQTGRVKISTIEHLMAAFCGLGIDNAFVDSEATEMPIMDGSAGPFVFLLQSAGIAEQNTPRRLLLVRRAVTVSDGPRWARLDPCDRFRVSYTSDIRSPRRGAALCASVDISPTVFIREIARARTFKFIDERDRLYIKRMGARGLTHNAVVIDDERILNNDGLRSPDEYLKHRILDAMGDLYLLGAPLLGAYTAFGADHRLTHRLMRAFVDDATAWDIVPRADAKRDRCIA